MPTSTNPIQQTLTSAISPTGTLANVGQTALSAYFSHLVILEFFSVLITLVLFVGIVVMIKKTGWLASRVDRIQHVVLKADMPKKKANDAWKKTQTHFFAGDDNDLKVAIMQADSLLEDALRYAGVRGGNLGERLKNIKKEQMPNLDQVWQAHKLRNQIAHEANVTIKRDLAERTLNIYEEALRNLGVLNDPEK